MNFITRFLNAWNAAKLQIKYDPTADAWTRDDAVWLSSALNHPLGQKWMRRLNNIVIREAVEATKRSMNPRYHCGKARGMALLKAAIDTDYETALTLASAKSSNTETTEDERDADDLDKILSQVL